MYCFVVVFFLQFKQLQRVVTMALKPLYRVCEIKKLDLIFSSFSVRSQNHSYKNSIVFRLARHLCSSTSLVINTYVTGCRKTDHFMHKIISRYRPIKRFKSSFVFSFFFSISIYLHWYQVSAPNTVIFKASAPLKFTKPFSSLSLRRNFSIITGEINACAGFFPYLRG